MTKLTQTTKNLQVMLSPDISTHCFFRDIHLREFNLYIWVEMKCLKAIKHDVSTDVDRIVGTLPLKKDTPTKVTKTT